jgi:radical SAM superfamily enzyme YgiQ (UPF0313 family)
VGLGYLATALRAKGFSNLSIVDCIKEDLQLQAFVKHIEELSPRILGFQCFSSDVAWVREAMELIRRKLPETILLAGGPHVSAVKEDIFQDLPEADYFVAGEAEPGLPMLADRLINNADIELRDIPGLIWIESGNLLSNPRTFVEDLDGLGFPAWDLMPPDTYPDSPQGAFYMQYPIAPIATTRGCPYRCAFCGSPVNMGNRLRLRSLDHVFQEMELLYHRYGVREFHFIDDMFNHSKSRVIEFCQRLEEKDWGVSYSFPNGLRLNTLDEETLGWMKRTGAYSFTVGIESGSQRILDLMNKKLTVELIREKVELIHRAGLAPSGFFLLGFPGETIQEMRMTLDLAKSLPLKRAHFSNFLPLPGSEATRRLLESGEIDRPDWRRLCYSETPYAPQGISREELKAFQRRAFLEFHLRPKALFKTLAEIKSPNHFMSIARRARDYLFKG